MGCSIKEIAKLANVSTATVSKVLNNKGQNISDKTTKRIVKIAAENNYTPNIIAKSLKNKSTFTLGIIIPDICNPYFAKIAKAVQLIAHENNYSVLICNTDDDIAEEKKAINVLNSRMVDGIIISSCDIANVNEYLNEFDIPFVFIDRVPNNSKSKFGSVCIDHKKEFRKITEYIIGKKCKTIAFIGTDSISGNLRKEGVELSLKAENILLEDDKVFIGSYDIPTGYEGAKTLLEKDSQIDAFICANDLIAVGVSNYLREVNIAIPSTIKVTGFDDIEIASCISPKLTTINQPIHFIGETAINILLGHIEENRKLENVIISCELIIRESA